MTLKGSSLKRQLNDHSVKAPPAYRPQPTPKCLQLKPIADRAPAMNQAPVKKQGPTPPSAYRPQSVPKVLQRKIRHPASQVRALGVVQRAEAVSIEEESAPDPRIWNTFTLISMPAPKHILEKMKAVHAKGHMHCSVVTQETAQDAVKTIGAHVKAHGWNSANGITVEWIPDKQWFKVTYKGNEWMTHTNGGQLWPLRGPNVFSPPEKTDVSSLIKKWKSTKTPPDQYMNQK